MLPILFMLPSDAGQYPQLKIYFNVQTRLLFLPRLLRQMGWTECDGCADGSDASDEPPLTDDEIREFFTRNKRKGLLAVPSITHRSFRDALTTWSQAHKSALACGSDSGKEDAALSSPSSSLSSSSSDSD